MRKIYLFLFLSLFSLIHVTAQTTVFAENMGSAASTTAISAHTFQNSGTLTYGAGELTSPGQPADVRNSNASTGYTGASGSGNVFFTSTAGDRGFSIENINASAFTNLTLDFAYRKENGSALPTFVLDYWNGTAWVNVPFTFPQAANAGTGWYLISGISLPAAAQINGLKLRWVKSGTLSVRLDDVKLTGVTNSPSIAVTSSLTAFSSNTGQPSAEQSYTVSGSNLTGNITITASTGYLISTTSGTGFASSVSLTPSAGTVAATTIYVVQNSTTLGANTGTLTHTSTGASAQVVNVSGNVFAAEPTTASTVSFTNVAGNSMDINFTGGNGSGRIVVVRLGQAVSGTPTDGVNYTANSTFGLGNTIAAGQFVVYNGTGNTVTINGLSGNTTYHVAVFEYNDGGVPAAINYYLTAGSGSQLTAAAIEGLQVSTLNQVYKIDFDNSVDYVNNGAFTGTNINSAPAVGDLNANAWAISTSAAPGSFGLPYTNGGGISTGGVTAGTFFAFEPEAGNRTLGVQPTGSYFNPGSLTLKIQNQTGNTINTLDLAYRLWVLNNGARANTFNFSYSTDNVTFTDVPTLNYASAEAADATPTWSSLVQVNQISGLSIAPGSFLYFRWSGADVSGSGSRDEFALDNITLVANPTGSLPLPIRFSALKASQKGSAIQLDWSNATEENVTNYSIERSANGRSFTQIGLQNARSNNNDKASYSFIDAAPLSGDNFYRIKATEATGKTVYTNVVRINTSKKGTDLVVYPNPLKGADLNVQLSNLPAGKYAVKVFSMSGQELDNRVMNHAGGSVSETISVKNLKPGLYTIQVSGAVNLQKSFIAE